MNIRNWEELEATILRVGMLPYFRNRISGFSVEENVPDSLLWDIDAGPWEWKGQVIRNFKVAYGKLYDNRAGYISLECLPDFMNVRRTFSKLSSGSEEERIYRILSANESLLSRDLKTLSGYSRMSATRKSANPFKNMPDLDLKASTRQSDSRFETAMTRLQMSGYVVIADFEYNYDRQGNRYGWGVARYTTPEALYEITPAACSAEESFSRLFSRLQGCILGVNPKLIIRLIEK